MSDHLDMSFVRPRFSGLTTTLVNRPPVPVADEERPCPARPVPLRARLESADKMSFASLVWSRRIVIVTRRSLLRAGEPWEEDDLKNRFPRLWKAAKTRHR